MVIKQLSGAVDHKYSYFYKSNAARDLDYIARENGLMYYPQTDVYNRNKGKILTDSSGNKKYGEYITYLKYGDHGTNLVSSIRYGRATSNGYVIKDCITYKYDSCGNITEISENGLPTAKYTYDALNRLVREDNRQLNKTTLWTYDNFGNILFKRTTSYTTKNVDEIESFTEVAYTYDGRYPDRLVSFGTESISYNSNGLPSSYRGKSLSWNGLGQLTSVGSTSFTYDGYGRRTKKGNTVFTYDFDGRLVKQSNGLEFFYDVSGLSGFKYNGTEYIYRKNAQGDITHMS